MIVENCDAVSAYPDTLVSVPVPRLGRGIVWSDILADIDSDQERREEGILYP